MSTPPTTNEVRWFKSRRSAGSGACVEVAHIAPHIAVRDSTDPTGPVLRFDQAQWRLFVSSISRGSFPNDRE
jgi:hypothetical protein